MRIYEESIMTKRKQQPAFTEDEKAIQEVCKVWRENLNGDPLGFEKLAPRILERLWELEGDG